MVKKGRFRFLVSKKKTVTIPSRQKSRQLILVTNQELVTLCSFFYQWGTLGSFCWAFYKFQDYLQIYSWPTLFPFPLVIIIEFCSTLGLKQLIKIPTRITCNTFTPIDHILTSSSEKVAQAGIIETSLSDHQLIFYTRKIKITKPDKHNYLTFRSMKTSQLRFTRKLWDSG